MHVDLEVDRQNRVSLVTTRHLEIMMGLVALWPDHVTTNEWGPLNYVSRRSFCNAQL